MLIGDRTVGELMVDDPRVALVSATGSTRMGKEVAPRVAARLGRTLLELGGNNAAIVAPSADLDLAVRGIVFSAVGTAGQRCTSLRRIIVHESIKDELVAGLKAAYETLPIGSPLESSTLVGPLVDEQAFRRSAPPSRRRRPTVATSSPAARRPRARAATTSTPRSSTCPSRPRS